MRKAFAFFVILLAFVAAGFSGQAELKPILEVMSLIKAQYVDDVPNSQLIDGAISGMLRALDPYSQYLSKESLADFKVETEGKFSGIGVEISIKGGRLHVVAPLADSPAERAGLKSEDLILKIDGMSTRDMLIPDVSKKLRGKADSVVTLSILRDNQFKEIPVKREWVVVKSVKQAKMLEPGVGYIQFTAFRERSVEDFKEALSQMQKQGARSLILDLRNNTGGYMEAAFEISELFIPKGKLILSTRGRSTKHRQYYSGNEKPVSFKPLLILMNKGSASSSEILAGALKDHKLAILVGVKSYGKGAIQTVIPLTKDSAVRLTTSRYYTPSGRVIQDNGIEPDVAVEDVEDTKEDEILNKALEIIHSDEKEKSAQV